MIFYSETEVVLFNINTNFEIFNFKSVSEINDLFLDDELKFIQSSSDPDIVCLGFGRKLIALNLKTCEIFFKFFTNATCCDFTQRINEAPYLISGSENGEIVIWDLNQKKLEIQIKNHFSKKIDFVMNVNLEDQELLVVGSGLENSVKIFRKDLRELYKYTLLRKRESNVFPLKKILLYRERFVIGFTEDPLGEMIRFSLLNDSANAKFSMKLRKKHQKI